MSFAPCQRVTPYCVLLSERVGQYFQDVGWAFTMKEIAQFAGLKPTHNMRKRLRSWVESGHLRQFTSLDEHGRMQITYSVPTPPEQAPELPF